MYRSKPLVLFDFPAGDIFNIEMEESCRGQKVKVFSVYSTQWLMLIT